MTAEIDKATAAVDKILSESLARVSRRDRELMIACYLDGMATGLKYGREQIELLRAHRIDERD